MIFICVNRRKILTIHHRRGSFGEALEDWQLLPGITFKCAEKTSTWEAAERVSAVLIAENISCRLPKSGRLFIRSSEEMLNISFKQKLIWKPTVLGWSNFCQYRFTSSPNRPHPTKYINYSNSVRSVTCSIEDLPRGGRREVALAMGLDEGRESRRGNGRS